MYPSALLAAVVCAAAGVAHVTYPERISRLGHEHLSANPEPSTEGRRRYEFRGALSFLFAFVFFLVAFAD